MAMVKDTGATPPTLTASREPVGPTAPGSKGTPGDRATMDAVFIVLGAWLILFFLTYTLRSHNV